MFELVLHRSIHSCTTVLPEMITGFMPGSESTMQKCIFSSSSAFQRNYGVVDVSLINNYDIIYDQSVL